MPTIIRPCYCTRAQAQRATDVQQAAYANVRIDRAIQAAADDIDSLTQRVFYVWDGTRYFDWPNYQYAYPWRLWLDQDELADVTVNPPSVNSGGVDIPNSAIFYGDPSRPYPPYTYFELDRSQSYSFGNGPTPQREIAVNGTFGYWLRWASAGTLAAAITDTTGQSVTVSDGASPGAGDVMLIDSERMLVTDQQYIDTGFAFETGITTASASDNVGTVSDGTKFTVDEVLLVDSEWMLIQMILGDTITVKRAWSGSVLTTHSGADIYAQRLLTVLRGQQGTEAATHDDAAPISVFEVPGLINQLAVAKAIVSLTNEPSAYAAYSPTGNVGSGVTLRSTGGISFGLSSREVLAGMGISGLEHNVEERFGRQMRSRVI